MKRMVSLTCVALLAVPAPARAQIGGGHSGTSTEWSFSGRIAFDELNAFGECFATKQTKDAMRLVSTEAGSVDEAKVYKELFSKDQFCLGNLAGLSVPWRYVRGAIAEVHAAQLLARDLGSPKRLAECLALQRDIDAWQPTARRQMCG